MVIEIIFSLVYGIGFLATLILLIYLITKRKIRTKFGNTVLIIFIECILLGTLFGISKERVCGCDCAAQDYGFKSYITKNYYPPIHIETKSKCLCACEYKYRFPIEVLPVYFILAFLLPFLIKKYLRPNQENIKIELDRQQDR